MFFKNSKNKSSLTLRESYIISSKKEFRGAIFIPGDKSISHRSLLLAIASVGTTKISNILQSEDILCTLKAIKLLGANVSFIDELIIIKGLGVGVLKNPNKAINMGNSGTGCRLLLGLITGSSATVTLTGDTSLSMRPMDRVIKPLRMMGAEITSNNMTLPISIKGAALNGYVNAIQYKSEIASAQVKSAILLAGLNARGITSVTEPYKSRDSTEIMLKNFGASIFTNKNNKNYSASILGYAELKGTTVDVPGDPSSAAFFAVAVIILKNSKIKLKNVYMSPLRIEIFNILKKMGAKIEFTNIKSDLSHGDIIVQSSKLTNIVVNASKASSLIDEYPILSIAAAFGKGRMVMKGLSELRYKESNRLNSIYEGLNKCGVRVEINKDDLIVHGCEGLPQGGCEINSNLDHRIAMSFAILGLASKEPIKVRGCSTVKTSFPNFFDLLSKLGEVIN